MLQGLKIIILTALVAVAITSSSSGASARGRYTPPLTQCGPDLAYLCPIHGYFDLTPFHYNLAIYPGCIQTRRVETPEGIRRVRVLVCG